MFNDSDANVILDNIKNALMANNNHHTVIINIRQLLVGVSNKKVPWSFSYARLAKVVEDIDDILSQVHARRTLGAGFIIAQVDAPLVALIDVSKAIGDCDEARLLIKRLGDN